MNLIHFSIALAIFLLLTAFILREYVSFVTEQENREESVETKLNALQVLRKILSLGIPSNWTREDIQQLGISEYIYKKPVIITETSGIDRGYTLVNLSGFVFDEDCSKMILNNTVRVYSYEEEIPFALFNQTFCEGGYLKNATIVLNTSFSAHQSKTFFVYFSSDSDIRSPTYSLPFNTTTGFNLNVYPAEKMLGLSVKKLRELRELNYTDAVNSLLAGYEIYVEVSE
jgi:hypothetical protein